MLCTLCVCTVYDSVRTQSCVSQRVCQRRFNFDVSSSPSAVEASTLITFYWERTRATFTSEAVVFLSIYLVFFCFVSSSSTKWPFNVCVA